MICSSNILMFEIILSEVLCVAIMDAQEIMDMIPNRYPICYIDYVDELVPGEKIIATKNVTINESFFRGHFPGNPVMPGVLLIETLAQAASILILKSISKAKFRKVVRPGDVLKLNVEMKKKHENMGIVDTQVIVDGKKACTAELMFIVADRDKKL